MQLADCNVVAEVDAVAFHAHRALLGWYRRLGAEVLDAISRTKDTKTAFLNAEKDLEVFMESFRAEGLSGLLYEDFPVLPGQYSEWLAKLDSIFSAVGQPSWRIMAWDSLSVTWDDVLDKRGLEDPTSRTGPSTSRTARGNYTAKQSALNLPGAWPNDDYSELVLKSATHPESESSAGLSRDIETGADRSGLDEKLTSTSGFLAWSSRRQAFRSREFMEATCLAFSDILSEDILSDAKEAFMEELEKGARVLSRQTWLFSDK